jgi:hypothetical protein
MMCGRPRSTGAPSCAFWLDRVTIDRLTALRGPGESYGVIIGVARG